MFFKFLSPLKLDEFNDDWLVSARARGLIDDAIAALAQFLVNDKSVFYYVRH